GGRDEECSTLTQDSGDPHPHTLPGGSGPLNWAALPTQWQGRGKGGAIVLRYWSLHCHPVLPCHCRTILTQPIVSRVQARVGALLRWEFGVFAHFDYTAVL